MQTITIEAYTYQELNAEAQAKARDWWREGSFEDNSFAEPVIEDAKHIGSLMGLEISRVYWSGFWSQGDGACFEGTWCAGDVQPGQVKEHAPKDKELHRIAAEFERLAILEEVGAGFTVKHRGHYYNHAHTEFDFEDGTRHDVSLTKVARDFMRWIYKQLEKQWDHQNSDEAIAENIQANEYLFTKEGSRSVVL